MEKPTPPPVELLAALVRASDVDYGRVRVPLRLLVGLAWVESRYQNVVNERTGAAGVMQLRPITARTLGVDARNTTQAAHAAARFLAVEHERFGDWDAALAAYNWGPEHVQERRHPRRWPAEVWRYVRNVQEAARTAPLPFGGQVVYLQPRAARSYSRISALVGGASHG